MKTTSISFSLACLLSARILKENICLVFFILLGYQIRSCLCSTEGKMTVQSSVHSEIIHRVLKCLPFNQEKALFWFCAVQHK